MTKVKRTKKSHDELDDVIDLDLYNFLTVKFLGGKGIDNTGDYLQEVLSHADKIEQLVRDITSVEPPLRYRLSLYKIDMLSEQIRQGSEVEEFAERADGYNHYTALSEKLEQLVDLLCLGIPERHKNLSFTSIVIELKTLIFSSLIQAGIKNENKYGHYNRAAARNACSTSLTVHDRDIHGMSKEAVAKYTSDSKIRLDELLRGVAEGSIDNYLDEVPNHVAKLSDFIATVLNDINVNSYPKLLVVPPVSTPAFAEPLTQLQEPLLTPFPINPHYGETDPKFKPARGKRMWTDEETEILRIGVGIYGTNWKSIKEAYPQLDRTPMQLKDRARSVRKILEAQGKPLMEWDLSGFPGVVRRTKGRTSQDGDE